MPYFTKRLAILLAATAVLSSPPASRAADFYIAQTPLGMGTGTDAADALAVGFFNTSSNWSGTPGTAGEISPGDTVHLVGTITTELDAQAGGTAGNVLMILFEPGCRLSTPAGWNKA